MGEGEFTLIRQHLESAVNLSLAWVGDHDVYAALTDAAARQGDEAALRQYAPPAEALADDLIAHARFRVGRKLYQRTLEAAGELDYADAA